MTCTIHISGIVQGVGFRPFIYRAAKKFDLKGYVRNAGNKGVQVVVTGEKNRINTFIQYIQKNTPNISRIESISSQWTDPDEKFTKFQILPSIKSKGDSIVLPPDISICQDCLRDFKNPNLNRYYNYPFIACSVCGPRFTTVTGLPYDRELTTMDHFPFCKDCLAEYSDPNNRRYHAQTFACNACGPQFHLHDTDGVILNVKNPFVSAAQLINEGKTIALMGIGGVHLVCLPSDEAVIQLRLKKRKRKYKPFAVMSPSIEKIRSFARVREEEESALTSFRRPIVLLEKRDDFNLSEEISPGLNNIGVFLPYSGIHYLLFGNIDSPALIMTSGNRSDIPMAITQEKVLEELQGMADGFLLHDRKIYQRCDDSVLLFIEGRQTLIRRSRGFVPEHLETAFPVKGLDILALGPELNSTISVLKKNRIFPSQHIGDVSSLETLEFLKTASLHLLELLQIDRPQALACDLNPIFHSTKLAHEFLQRFNSQLIHVQHHHAHQCALMNEYMIHPDEEIVGILLDGVGFGTDRKAWGGEIFVGNYVDFDRVAHLEAHPLPGGDRCVYYPVRMMTSILSKTMDRDDLLELVKRDYLDGLPHGQQELKVLLNQLEDQGTTAMTTTGMGRVLDALSAMLGICFERTYEGEPAIRLDHVAQKGNPNRFKFEIPIKDQPETTLNTSQLLRQALKLKENRESLADIAASATKVLAENIANVAVEKALERDLKKIGLSGGCAYNRLIVSTIKAEVEANNLEFLQHLKVPAGDACVSIGQAIHAAAYLTYF